MRVRAHCIALTAIGLIVSCTPAGPPASPAPGATGGTATLPPVPAADGPLRITVIYPLPDAQLTSSDSNFIFGAAGSGRATLRINGTPVQVAPNGAYLAFLPVPPDGRYLLEATKDGETARLERAVRVPAHTALSGVMIDEASVYPTGAFALPAGEPIEVGFRGTRGASASLRLPDGRRLPLVESAPPSGTDAAANFLVQGGMATSADNGVWYRGVMPAMPITARASPVARPALAALTAVGDAVVELTTGSDTVTVPLPLNVATLDPLPISAIVTAPPNAPHDWTARGRPSRAGPYHWFWPAGTRLRVDGESNGFFRARLAGDLSAWLPTGDVMIAAPGAPSPAAPIGAARFIARETSVDLQIPLAVQLPFAVDGDGRSLTIELYGATSETNFFQYGSLDPLLERAMWSQPADGVYRVSVQLAQPVWGYHAYYAEGALIVRIRRPPAIDATRPLAGLLIAVDAGHPPAGATGPTGLTEAEANLAISFRLQSLLVEAGARVLMTRTDAGPVELGSRPRMAADSNAHVLLSIHNNAFPDGVNPFANHGTSVYFYQPHSLDLAKHVQRGLLAELGTRDIGIGRADLALARPTWMPSALSETLFMMIPQQEAALRDPAAQERIARAHVRALEAFLRERAGR